ncbi:orotate phosphoribosyltransferase/AMMECR1 domain-containing protein [Mycobacterium sp. OAS707]|uniref:AMMECR1 domain-containing protein n=1 Tax=Mycobacterium sp. OAS707 TaxID=2663822 RepID=UPI00178BC67C|nr:AMMECR1 domain-containing protein [Mycobacterium sp. OAS707]MBE1551825.1 orotate phosphoribosyltransferase/AMMECR1 domain-containing protein [Mycobacterium sp. OAS707]
MAITARRSVATEDERAEFLEMLRTDGILHRTPSQPVLSRDGSSARWMLDSLAVTLTPRGAHLASSCLLDVLQSFESRQLVTYGLTGVPLLQGCILGGGGLYRGALVRKEAKKHGSCKLMEGKLDPSEPVVIIDDSISSGFSAWTCADRLEEAGFQVEGAVCLVRFRYDLGVAKLQARGLRVAAVFDIFSDFMRHMDGEEPPPANPTKTAVALAAAVRRAPEGLHPAVLAREAVAEYLNTGRALRAPDTLAADYDSAGGCWISLRRRTDIHDRCARDGFWHFPGEARGTPCTDVVTAAVQTAQQLSASHSDPHAVLNDCAIAVTFFGALEECTVGELDNDRYGIVVRSTERDSQLGGALPRMPGIANEWQQFWHAARRNAQLFELEPYHLYRHDVVKVVEPGVRWQPTGAPDSPRAAWPHDAATELARQARAHAMRATGAGQPVTLPDDICGLFVTVYANGAIAGCAGGFNGDLAASLPEFTDAALADERFAGPAADAQIAVSVSLLANQHEIGAAAPEWVTGPLRFGDQALAVRQGHRRGFLLPSVAMTHNLTPQGYVNEVIDKAGITRPPYYWTRYDCASWLADAAGVHRMQAGLPVGAEDVDAARLRELLTSYTVRVHDPSGDPVNRYEVFADRLRTGMHPARFAYGAWIKARAGLTEQCIDDLNRLQKHVVDGGWVQVDDQPATISEVAFVVLAQLESGVPVDETMLENLWSRIDCHGRFATHRDTDIAAYQDYAPGQALLALAVAAQRGVCAPRCPDIDRALRYYRMRFRQNHSWGAVAWLMQAFVVWASVLDDVVLWKFAYEIADWALTFQSDKTGAFLNDHQPDTPGATTALYLEGIAAVRAAADSDGDGEREARYRRAARAGVRFLDRLVYQDRDAAVLPNADWALGGVRSSLTSSEVRTDYVHHALSALMALDGVLAS